MMEAGTPSQSDSTSTSTTTTTETLTTSIARRLASLPVSNPFPGVTSFKSYFSLLKKEAPKVLDVRKYSKPTSMEQATTRIKANISFFRITYTFVLAAVVLLYILSNPTLFIATILLGIMWSAFLSQSPDHVLKLGSIELKRTEKLVILVSSTVIIVVFGGLISSALYVVFTSGLFIGAHGAFREPVEIDALDQLEQEGESIVKGDIV